MLASIKAGYNSDTFCQRLAKMMSLVPSSLMVYGMLATDSSSHRLVTYMRTYYSVWHMTHLAILVLINLMQTCAMHIIGQTCALIWRNPISPPALTASRINLEPPKLLYLCTCYLFLIALVIVWLWISLGCCLKTVVTTASSP